MAFTAIADMQVYPDIDKQRICVKVDADKPVFTLDGREVKPEKGADGLYVLPIRDMKLWSEFMPHLYTLNIEERGERREKRGERAAENCDFRYAEILCGG